ncbi:flavodoxin family protein [Thermopirellula anaerolimosa]
MGANAIQDHVNRRAFLGTTAAAGMGTVLAANGLTMGSESGEKIKIVAVSCSPRKGKTTAQGLKIVLDAAAQAAPDRIETVLIELAGLSLPLEPAFGQAVPEGVRDDFGLVAEQLGDPALGALIVGSPVHYANMSTLCKTFIDRLGMFRKDFRLSGKVAGALAVGAARNGGQEWVLRSIQNALICHEMLLVGDGKPTGHFGATLWNNNNDDISTDEFGVKTAVNLGRHAAEIALRLAR